ncbi:metal-dependent phosphohydrolase [Anaerocolumna cellulosilytica]|uniref:Metal-dependent phosphohydrolase n=1 Tax=Anaerocolumna cellulosilytica TaxID=433286 RepID=A0A6S6QSW9_9FIRM|nr:HD domain-containing protein [Anaerocolumna cellulosilytica]MBB5196435.1 uncharacterized protein [Anaerocolumna cellulosilytica]BCJ94443.1 metal-dependent phosphohydrolase [Anaerocolumna cellulosilytica]
MTYIEKTEEFLRKTFEDSNYFVLNQSEKNYRLEHSYRVANIVKKIAQKEGLDEEGLVIAGLLHDISYCDKFDNEEDWKNHGRKSARIARRFLEEIGMDSNRIQEICYGIAIHVDDEADFEGKKTPFSISVGDADNIDRFDVYRIYETLQVDKFSEMGLLEKREYVTNKVGRLGKLMEVNFGTSTAKDLWCSNLMYQKEFFEKLLSQLEHSGTILYELVI